MFDGRLGVVSRSQVVWLNGANGAEAGANGTGAVPGWRVGARSRVSPISSLALEASFQLSIIK